MNMQIFLCLRLQVSTSQLCKLHTGPGLATRLVVMSQNPARIRTRHVKLRLKGEHREIFLLQWMNLKTALERQTLHIDYSAQ